MKEKKYINSLFFVLKQLARRPKSKWNGGLNKVFNPDGAHSEGSCMCN